MRKISEPIAKACLCIAIGVAVIAVRAQDATTPAQNAVLEGLQLSSQAGTEPGEKVVTGYFIFRDKPSSYFYELKQKEKTLVFEFYDSEKGASPIPSTSEDPILGFSIDQKKVDVNKEVTGLNPEWHDVIVVTLKLRKLPIVTVDAEYNITTFTYKWTTDPAKVEKYTVKEKKNQVWVWTGVGLGVVGAVGVTAYLLTRNPPPPPDTGLTTLDLPLHQQ
jgi:hypothetical protein